MDTITTLAMSVDEPIIKAVGMFLHDAVVYAVVVFVLLFIGERRADKRKKVILAFLITLLIVYSAKFALARERPCFGEEWCPGDHSFPSAHAAIAFTLMTAFLDKKGFPIYLIFALFVAFTRMNIGVHTFYDIAGALPLAMLSYYITDEIWRRIK